MQTAIEMRFTLPATLQAMEAFFAAFQGKSRAMLDSGSCFTAELLVREALTNAVVHGCNTNPRMRVRCFLRLKGKRLLISVKDDGDGFDWRAASAHSVMPLNCSGRGIAILRKLSNHVRYNQRGNAVTIVKRFD